MANDSDILALVRKINVWSFHAAPSMPLTRPFQHGLGTLNCLPPEIRSRIWQELFQSDSPTEMKDALPQCSAQQQLPSNDPVQQTKCKTSIISILFASAQLYRETFPELYRHHKLIICFSRDHHHQTATARNLGAVFHSHVNRECVPRDFIRTDLSRFRRIELSIHLPPDTDMNRFRPPRRSPMNDRDLNTVQADLRRFCQLVRWCQWSKPLQPASWPGFSFSVTLDASCIVEPDPLKVCLRHAVGLMFVGKLLGEMTVIKDISLQDVTINVVFKLRCDDGYLRRTMCEPFQHMMSTRRKVADDECRYAAILHCHLQISCAGDRAPAYESKRDISVRYRAPVKGFTPTYWHYDFGKEFDVMLG